MFTTPMAGIHATRPATMISVSPVANPLTITIEASAQATRASALPAGVRTRASVFGSRSNVLREMPLIWWLMRPPPGLRCD